MTGDKDREQESHDAIIRMDANLTNFLLRFDEHVKEERSRSEQHAQEDAAHFERLYKRTARLDKFLWMAMGAVAVFEFVIRYIKK